MGGTTARRFCGFLAVALVLAACERRVRYEIEVTNPTSRPLRVTAAHDGQTHELGVVRPNDTREFYVLARRGTRIFLEARDSLDAVRVQDTLTVAADATHWRISAQ